MDIVGSTAIGMAHDPEVVRETLARAFAALSEILDMHGGTVEKFIGDAVMAVFGVPSAHDDDAERAVRAAFACRTRIAELNRSGQFAIEVRIGVNTGEAVAGTGQAEHFLVTGTPVTMGARLQQAAAPGEILAGSLTRQLTRGGVRYGPAREIDAKGAGRIDAFEAQALISPIPEQHRGIEGHRASLVGRDRELQLLRDAFARVVDTGTASLVTIYGPAGAGKSRLTTEFTEEIGPERVRSGRCLPYGHGITLYAIQQMLRSDVGIEPSDGHDTALRKLRERVAVLFSEPAESGAIFARLSVIIGFAEAGDSLPQAAPSDVAEELRWGVRRYFERRAAGAALVLVFEDVHWGEVTLLDLIEQIAEWSRAPLLLIAVARPDFREVRPTWGSNVANALSVTLGPLPADDTRRLLSEILAVDALPERLRAQVITRSEGNPLYVEEFLRMLMDAERIVLRDGRWVAMSEAESLDVPATLLGLIAARLDRVSPNLKRLLQHASLVGRLFSTSALTAIGGEPADRDLLREAVRRDLLLEADERAPGEGGVYRFKHVLIRDVAYGTITKGERARMHDNYARWLEGTFGDRRSEFGDLIAYHAEQAFHLANELGRTEAADLGARALSMLLAVATAARARQDPVAKELYARAARVADAFHATEQQRAEAHGFEAILRFEQLDDASGLEAALVLCEAAGPSEVLVKILDDVAKAHADQERDEVARGIWDRAVELAEGLGNDELIAKALLDRALGAYFINDIPRYKRLLPEALDFARSKAAHRTLVSALARNANGALNSGSFTLAREYLDERARLLPKELSRIVQTNVHNTWSQFHLERGDARQAAAAAELALASAKDSGVPAQTGMCAWHLGQALLDLGEFARARSILEEGTAVMDRLKRRGQIPELAARCARACIALNDIAGGRRYLDIAEKAVFQGDVEARTAIGIARAELSAATGDAQGADAAFRETLAAAEASSFRNQVAHARVAFARLLIRQTRLVDAREQLRAARNFYHDPLAQPGRDRIDALLKQCEVGVV